MLFPLFRPALFAIDAETAHGLTIAVLDRWGTVGAPLAPKPPAVDRLRTRVAGIDFANPVGLAAGADKNARALRGFLALGFGFVEAGTLTLHPQDGNPRPRLFRLVEDRAVINRMGFNNGGLEAALPRARTARHHGTIGINVGANKDSADRVGDYARAVALASAKGASDYVTINISSPNTPGLRDLQHGAALRDLLGAADEARRSKGVPHPLFLKVAPDLDRAAIDDIAIAAIDNHIDALIVSNTTLERAGLRSARKSETGGLSGAPLAPIARQRLADFRTSTGGRVPLISVGGIDAADEAYARIQAGASLVQLYTGLVYHGPGLAHRLASGIADLLERDGFTSVADAVGTGPM